eukprot:1226-Heterococcus_DN1.PRE.2
MGTFRAKNSYSIERRPIDYVPTATLGSCCGRVPCCKSCKLKQSELKLNFYDEHSTVLSASNPPKASGP